MRWNDERGFGFISYHGDGGTVFVHIKAFSHTSRRPVVGDIVSYEMTNGENGKSRAEKVCFSDQSQPKKQVAGKRQNNTLPVLFVSFFVCFLFVATYFKRIPWWVVVAYFAASLVTFFAYAWDKSSAKRGKWRTAESNLHIMGLLV